MILVKMNSVKYKDFWRMAYQYEEYLKEKYGRPGRVNISSAVFKEFMREKHGFKTIKAISGDRFGTFYIDESEYVWLSLKFL